LAAALARLITFSPARGGKGVVTPVRSERQCQPQPLESSAIAGIRSVTQEPGTNQVSIKYDTVSTQEAQGSLNDQRIQQLLLFAARSNYNSGVRMDSVDVLTQAPDDSRVREALMYALQNDTNPGVRLKALDGLSGFVRQDAQVRDGVLRALISDSELRRSDAGLATGGADESRQQCALGADQSVADGSERLDPFAGSYDAGADAGDGLGTSFAVRYSLLALD
jgi:hypothetical protein